eukprot:gene15118-biopygen10512
MNGWNALTIEGGWLRVASKREAADVGDVDGLQRDRSDAAFPRGGLRGHASPIPPGEIVIEQQGGQRQEPNVDHSHGHTTRARRRGAVAAPRGEPQGLW